MSFKKIFLFSLLVLAVPTICFASFNIKDWKYYKDIDFSGSDLVKVELDREVFANSQSDRDDLRVINEKQEEVPYKTMIGGVKDRNSNSYNPKLLNNSFVPEEGSSVILDMGSSGKMVERISIFTDSKNFQRNVRISGSDSRNNWKILKDDAYIYDYTDERGGMKTRDLTIDIPESVYRYIKVEIDDSAGDPVRIRDARTYNAPQIENKTATLDADFQVEQRQEEKESEIIVDMGVSGTPVEEISLETDSRNFHRGVYIRSSENKEDWRYLDSGYIFRYDTDRFVGEDLSLSFPETRDRYIKITIANKDNKSLNISDVKASYELREIAFRAKQGQDYKLYYGNPEAKTPQYDIDKYFPYMDTDDHISVSLSQQKENSSYIQPEEPQAPLTERVPYLLPGALLLTCAVLLFLVFRFLKK